MSDERAVCWAIDALGADIDSAAQATSAALRRLNATLHELNADEFIGSDHVLDVEGHLREAADALRAASWSLRLAAAPDPE